MDISISTDAVMYTGLHVGLCTEYPQSADALNYYTILTIATSISIPYLVS